MVTTRIQQATPAKDIIISLADKLPKNLMILRSHEKFAIDLISRLNEKQLSILSDEVKKKDSDKVFLEFLTKHYGSKECAAELMDYSNFNWGNVFDIEINGDTVPYLHSIHSDPTYYVSIIFILNE